jgi:transketolase
MPIDPVSEKWQAFGWQVLEIDGHDMAAIVSALEAARTVQGKPTIIIANTVKGKGVSFMENVPAWHGKAPDTGQYEKALEELLVTDGEES